MAKLLQRVKSLSHIRPVRKSDNFKVKVNFVALNVVRDGLINENQEGREGLSSCEQVLEERTKHRPLIVDSFNFCFKVGLCILPRDCDLLQNITDTGAHDFDPAICGVA